MPAMSAPPWPRLRLDTAQLPRLVYWTNGLTKPDYIHYLDPGLLALPSVTQTALWRTR